jgi:hypothetical protein
MSGPSSPVSGHVSHDGARYSERSQTDVDSKRRKMELMVE